MKRNQFLAIFFVLAAIFILLSGTIALLVKEREIIQIVVISAVVGFIGIALALYSDVIKEEYKE